MFGSHSSSSDAFPKKKSVVHEDHDIDITPMIDCVFLLLIFFIVTSKVGSTAGVELPQAEYGAAVSMKNAIVVTIDAGADGGAVIYKGPTVDESTRITVSDLEEQEQQIVNYVEARLAESPTPTAVVVQAAGKLKHREVGRILKAIGQVESEIETFHLAVMQRAT
jgi:biopolymer transport protein ExbD